MSGFAGFFDLPLQSSANGPVAVAFDGAFHDQRRNAFALYTQHGAACVERLRGPFALAVWDARDGGTGLLARDPMGLRSLYYFHDAGTGRLSFATGVKALMADGTVPRQLDARGLYGFFRHGAVPEPFSMVAGVHALPKPARGCSGGRASSPSNGPRRRRPLPFPPDDREIVKSLRAALLDSVANTSRTTRRRGCSWVGGLGSAALLALAREAGREKHLRALTIGFDDAATDETDLARRTAAHFGVPHTHLRLDRARARAWFDDYLPALDQPGVHGFPMFALCRFAREEGITVALAGIGLAELFGDPALHARLKRMTGTSGEVSLRALSRWAFARRDAVPVAADAGGFPFASADVARRVCRRPRRPHRRGSARDGGAVHRPDRLRGPCRRRNCPPRPTRQSTPWNTAACCVTSFCGRPTCSAARTGWRCGCRSWMRGWGKPSRGFLRRGARGWSGAY